MCGIAGIVGTGWEKSQLDAMLKVQNHRGPDDQGAYINESSCVVLGHNRLSIIDLSPTGHNPMSNARGDIWIVFNGEVYNYLELKLELSNYPYRSKSDTEVVLAAYEKWGEDCLNHFIGMFAFLLWDEREKKLLAVRDRFGVKPLYYHQTDAGTLYLASEIKALHCAGIEKTPDETTWSTYLTNGLYDFSPRTFWKGIQALPAGHLLSWKDQKIHIHRWYDLSLKVKETDDRPIELVEEEYFGLLKQSVQFRFRSDVPVGINLSGGLDSSTLLAIVGEVQGKESEVKAFTFTTGDSNYDELPWVKQMLAQTKHPSVECRLKVDDVPELARSVAYHQDEPFGGLPTIAYANLFRKARDMGVIVLLDGNGMDEQWGGYDYYLAALEGKSAGTVQGTKDSPVRPECLNPEFRKLALRLELMQPTDDPLRNLQLRDIGFTKIPRAMRFNDRISMRSSCELREPFLDHRLFELALRQPVDRKIRDGVRKWMLRQITSRLLPSRVAEAPKRPLQTPQREWLRGPLRQWAMEMIETGIKCFDRIWLNGEEIRKTFQLFCDGGSDNSFFVWQWIGIGLISEVQSMDIL